ncbi:isthmin 1, angiogenesis inhibitor, partial [Columba livia]
PGNTGQPSKSKQSVQCVAFFPQNTLAADDHSSEDGFTLNPEDRREYPDLQAAHRPFPKQRFRQENGHTSLQRDGPRSFLLDLPNFPDLSKADINGQNPNIQVTIEVVDGPDTEADKDLQKESSKPSWPVPSPDLRSWWQRSSTLTRMSSGDQDYKYDSNTEDSNFLNPLSGWDGHTPSHRTFESKEQPEYDYIDGEGDWSLWSPPGGGPARSGRGPVGTPAPPPSPAPATGPTAQGSKTPSGQRPQK